MPRCGVRKEQIAVPGQLWNMRLAMQTELLDLIRQSALFAGLTEEECCMLLACAHTRSYAKNELVYLQGNPVTNLIMIQTGSVKLTQTSSEGNEAILWIIGGREIVGIHAEFSGLRHSCSARAMEASRALVWEYRVLQSLGPVHTKLGKNMTRMLSTRLRDLEERFCEIATEKAARRLALSILRLVKSVGRPCNGGFEVGVMREELAQLTGSTPFTISRILARWSDLGLVVLSRTGIVIPDPERLKMVDDQGR